LGHLMNNGSVFHASLTSNSLTQDMLVKYLQTKKIYIYNILYTKRIMEVEMKTGGCRYGTHRVVEPNGVLPQPARILNNDMSEIWDNELLLDVIRLNIDSASFHQIKTKLQKQGHHTHRQT
jgi:hypothetical protein